MNKILFEKKFGGEKIISVESTDEGFVFSTEKNKVSIYTHHDQDCCEHVYGDFSIMKYHDAGLKGREIQGLVIKGVEDMGFLLCFDCGYSDNVKVFIPCYNYQNGYYSDDLSLVVDVDGVKTTVVITDLVEDQIG